MQLQLTDFEKRWLAEDFCGAEVVQDYCLLYCFPDGTQVQSQDFDPLNNWNHMWLVMKALVKNKWFYWLTRFSEEAFEHKNTFNLAKTVVQAALKAKELTRSK